jgi:drug/metabolite transporter (DMT)-like permease
VWGVILDATLWGVLPGPVTWLGAAIIIASGLYMFRRERALEEGRGPAFPAGAPSRSARQDL